MPTANQPQIESKLFIEFSMSTSREQAEEQYRLVANQIRGLFGYRSSVPEPTFFYNRRSCLACVSGQAAPGSWMDVATNSIWVPFDKNRMMEIMNPRTSGRPEKIADRITLLMPTSQPVTDDQTATLDAERNARWRQHQEARYGQLPVNTYRLLEQGGAAGWYLELEIDDDEIILEGQIPEENRYTVFADNELAIKLARAEIARQHGQAAADAAQFVTAWGENF